MVVTPAWIEQWTAITNVALTVGLLLFAGMQWWVTLDAEKVRRRERQHDLDMAQRQVDDNLDRAFQTVWAEHFRLDGLAAYWEKHDLVALSAHGILRSEDLLPKDWTTIVQALAQLGRECAFLGGVALTLAHDTEREVAKLNALVDTYRSQRPQLSPEELTEFVRQNRGGDSTTMTDGIRHMARDLSKLMWDAARQSPRANIERALDFSDDLESDFARAAVGALVKRSSPGKPSRMVPPGAG